MALFSRRDASENPSTPDDAAAPVDDGGEEAPTVGISVQAFRGMGSEAGPQVAIDATPAVAAERPLPLAPLQPPAQEHTAQGIADNILLREALGRLDGEATTQQMLGVLRQGLQGHLLLRVAGDAQAQAARGEPISVSIVRDGDASFLLAFSSAKALKQMADRDATGEPFSVVAQPIATVLQQVAAGGFTGLIVDNASAPHRAVFPAELLARALGDMDQATSIKSLLAVPPTESTEAAIARALATTPTFVAASKQPDGRIGVAEVRTPDGSTFLQLFTHPLEVVALGRDDRPLPFAPEQLAQALSMRPELAGVLIDPAGPTLVVRRAALAPVLSLASEA